MKTILLQWSLLSIWIGVYAVELVVKKEIQVEPAVLTNGLHPKAASRVTAGSAMLTSAANIQYQRFRWGLWGEWGKCNVQCGTGQMLRQRVCYFYERKIVSQYRARADPAGTPTAGIKPASNYLSRKPPADMFFGKSTCRGSNLDSKPCVMPLCPIPTAPCLAEWSAYSECSSTCGSGVRTRSRACSCKNKLGGTDCPLTEESVQCSAGLPECEPAVVWSAWLEWSICSVTCGAGTRERIRFCMISNACDPAGNSEKANCNAGVCEVTPTPLRWGEWASWSECSKTCGSGIRTRNRFCIGSNVCDIDGFSQTEVCTQTACPIFDTYGPWSEWSECSVTCGSGLKKRNRPCPGVCIGPDFEINPCDEKECVIPGKYSDWFPNGECRRLEGTNQCYRERARMCLGPGPCEGPSVESISCTTGECAPTTTQSTTTRAANQDRCDLRGAEGRVDCGYPGIPKNECIERGCCFSDIIYDVNWCFYDDGAPIVGRSGQVNTGGGGTTIMP